MATNEYGLIACGNTAQSGAPVHERADHSSPDRWCIEAGVESASQHPGIGQCRFDDQMCVGRQEGIGMEEQEDLPSTGLCALVHLACTTCRSGENLEVGDPCAKRVSNRNGSVGTSSINDDEVEEDRRLETRQGLRETVFFIEGGDDDGDRHRFRMADKASGLRCRLLFFSEHEVHDDNDCRPEDNLFVPEEDFTELEKTQRDADGADCDRPSEHRLFDDRVCPNSHAAKIEQQRHHAAEFESPADRQKDLEKSQKHEGGAHHLAQDPHVMVAAEILLVLLSRRRGRWIVFCGVFGEAHGHALKCLLRVNVWR